VVAEAVAVTEAAAVVAFTALAMAAIATLVAAELVPAVTATLVAAELVPAVMATLVAMELVPVATPAMVRFKASTACITTALAAVLVVTGECMPKRVQGRAVMPCEETFVRAMRTGTTMLMTHLGYSHLCLKMCRKIYI
jgi:hypothetical protein